jgi:hypothetical protein
MHYQFNKWVSSQHTKIYIDYFNVIIPVGNANQKSGLTQTSGYIRGRVRCLGEISIPTNSYLWLYQR